jgi:hypothetical protein
MSPDHSSRPADSDPNFTVDCDEPACLDAGFEPNVRIRVAETSILVAFITSALGVASFPKGWSRSGFRAYGQMTRLGAYGGTRQITVASPSPDRRCRVQRTATLMPDVAN